MKFLRTVHGMTLRDIVINEDVCIYFGEENVLNRTKVHGSNMYQEPLHIDSHDWFHFIDLLASETWDHYR
jgi:hypothetical protein